MSVKDILQHSIDKNPLAMKEALAEELNSRIQTAIQEMMEAEEVELDEEIEELGEEDEMEDDEDDDDDDDMDEAACVREMKKLHASNCSKNEMYKTCNEKYGCSESKFEALYAQYCK